jgi:hypothetical protein
MPVSVTKKIAGQTPDTVAPIATTIMPTATTPAAPAIITPPAANANIAPSGTPSWMLRGAAKHEAQHSEEVKAAVAKASRDVMRRFKMKAGESRQAIFLDGDLDEAGLIDGLGFYEHSMPLMGKRTNFTCLSGVPDMPPCPACESGDKSALVTALTVLNISPYTIQNGPRKGVVIPFQRQLFVCKKRTLALLQFTAKSIGGLKGKQFDIARIDTGDGMSPNVGTLFNPTLAWSMEEMVEKFGEEESQPADYGKEIPFLNAEQLIAMGAGKAPAGPGYEAKTYDKAKLQNAM